MRSRSGSVVDAERRLPLTAVREQRVDLAVDEPVHALDVIDALGFEQQQSRRPVRRQVVLGEEVGIAGRDDRRRWRAARLARGRDAVGGRATDRAPSTTSGRTRRMTAADRAAAPRGLRPARRRRSRASRRRRRRAPWPRRVALPRAARRARRGRRYRPTFPSIRRCRRTSSRARPRRPTWRAWRRNRTRCRRGGRRSRARARGAGRSTVSVMPMVSQRRASSFQRARSASRSTSKPRAGSRTIRTSRPRAVASAM